AFWRTITQPTGTSPACPAAPASSNASSMNDGMVRLAPNKSVCYSEPDIDEFGHGGQEATPSPGGRAHRQGDRARPGWVAARGGAETWTGAGRVAVNGSVIASPAVNVTAKDRVTVDGAALPTRERTRLFLYHKPRGLVTTHADPQGRPTIFAALPKHLPR